MSFQEFIATIGFKSEISFWAVLAFLMSIGIEIVPKIKWNPWSSLIKWIGAQFNSKIDSNIDSKIKLVQSDIQAVDKKVEYLQHEVTKVQDDLTNHIKESEMKSLQDTRRDILDFGNACMNGRKHTKEQFDFVIKQCDEYEKYIEKTDTKNGVIEAAIHEIRRLYEKCIHENSFLKEGER